MAIPGQLFSEVFVALDEAQQLWFHVRMDSIHFRDNCRKRLCFLVLLCLASVIWVFKTSSFYILLSHNLHGLFSTSSPCRQHIM